MKDSRRNQFFQLKKLKRDGVVLTASKYSLISIVGDDKTFILRAGCGRGNGVLVNHHLIPAHLQVRCRQSNVPDKIRCL